MAMLETSVQQQQPEDHDGLEGFLHTVHRLLRCCVETAAPLVTSCPPTPLWYCVLEYRKGGNAIPLEGNQARQDMIIDVVVSFCSSLCQIPGRLLQLARALLALLRCYGGLQQQQHQLYQGWRTAQVLWMGALQAVEESSPFWIQMAETLCGRCSAGEEGKSGNFDSIERSVRGLGSTNGGLSDGAHFSPQLQQLLRERMRPLILIVVESLVSAGGYDLPHNTRAISSQDRAEHDLRGVLEDIDEFRWVWVRWV